MCGRFTLRAKLNLVLRELDVHETVAWMPRYNIAPTQDVATIHQEDGKRLFRLMRWGLVPSWAKEIKKSNPLINARAETVAESPAFRGPFKKRRCLVLADGYYEWQTQNGKKQPFLIHLPNYDPFAFAGLWDCRAGDSEPLESCTIITAPATDATRHLHDRMPVILPCESWNAWLAPDSEPGELKDMLSKSAVSALAIDLANPIVNSPKNDLPACVQPLAP